jgi:hypothetical protein
MDTMKKSLKLADDRRAQFEKEILSLRTIMKVEDELNGVDLVKTIMKAEDERRVQVQKKKDSMKIMAAVDEPCAHSENEAGSVKIETERLPLTITEETVGNPASMESPFKMGSPRKNCIAAFKATGEKEKKLPTTNLKAVRAEAVYRSNTYHRPGESRMKTRHQKLGSSRIQAKVNTWRCNKILCICNSSIK